MDLHFAKNYRPRSERNLRKLTRIETFLPLVKFFWVSKDHASPLFSRSKWTLTILACYHALRRCIKTPLQVNVSFVCVIGSFCVCLLSVIFQVASASHDRRHYIFTIGILRVMEAIISLGCNWWSNMHQIGT